MHFCFLSFFNWSKNFVDWSVCQVLISVTIFVFRQLLKQDNWDQILILKKSPGSLLIFFKAGSSYMIMVSFVIYSMFTESLQRKSHEMFFFFLVFFFVHLTADLWMNKSQVMEIEISAKVDGLLQRQDVSQLLLPPERASCSLPEFCSLLWSPVSVLMPWLQAGFGCSPLGGLGLLAQREGY